MYASIDLYLEHGSKEMNHNKGNKGCTMYASIEIYHEHGSVKMTHKKGSPL